MNSIQPNGFFHGVLTTVSHTLSNAKQRIMSVCRIAMQHKAMTFATMVILFGSVVSNILAFILSYLILCFIGLQFMKYWDALSLSR